MKTVYIFCNSENKQSSNYIQFGAAGSSLGRYLASAIGQSEEYSTVILNLGSPSKKRKSVRNTKIYSETNFKIVEFKSLSKILPSFMRAKKVLREAVKYLKRNFKEGDKVLIYHSLFYSTKYKKILDIAGVKNSLLFVAEIYSDVFNKTKLKRNSEIKYIRLFDKFICMSKNLSKICCDDSNKQCILLFGAYSSNIQAKKTSNNKINIVYSGTASRIKNGLYMAIEAMEYLDSNFLLHIYCPATQSALEAMKDKKNIVYEGYLSESLLNEALPNFHIGLASQDPFGDFNSSSFPSKIIKYLSCGLSVVSSASISVIDSPFADVVKIFDPYDPERLAESIIEASKKINPRDNIQIIEKMDYDFKIDVIKLIDKEE